ncbi:uncharacterized protein V1518DRAFT_245919 [Limtongia smithiae]|uniref:uncharacterized protein n=1 Tax=Limtongia smithiae TaxID=1125753 RepID=UPI0034CF1C34
MTGAVRCCSRLRPRHRLTHLTVFAIAPRLPSRPFLLCTYATSDSPPFDHRSASSSSSVKRRSLLESLRSLFGRGGSGSDSTTWQTRGDAYEPDAEWESLQQLSTLIRRAKAELVDGRDLEELRELDSELREAVSDVLRALTKEELSVTHTRLINEAWNVLYTPKIGDAPVAHAVADVVLSSDSARFQFNVEELRHLLYLIVRFDEKSDHHVVLGRKVYQALMRQLEPNSKHAHQHFMLFVVLLSRNKADNEMLVAFQELLCILRNIDEPGAVALVSIINNVADQKVQEILVSRLFESAFVDISAFNVVLQAAIENGMRNIWPTYNKIAGASGEVLLPDLDTYELLFRYVVKDPENPDSIVYMSSIKDVLFDTPIQPAFDILDNQWLYRSYLTACIVSGDISAAADVMLCLEAPDTMPLLEQATFDVCAQWIVYSSRTVSAVCAFLERAAVFGHITSTETLNGILRASQVGPPRASDEDHIFRDGLFSLFAEYGVAHDSTSMSLRIRDRLRAGKTSDAVAAFRQAEAEGLTWDIRTDDIKASYLLLDALARLEGSEFDAQLLVELYKAVRVFTNSVDYATRLTMCKGLIAHGELGTLRDLLQEEMGEYQYAPAAFPELYDMLNATFLDCTDAEAAWIVYEGLQKHFVVAYESYAPMIEKFCDLDYCSAALELFRHLRKDTNTPPQADVYATVFHNFAQRNYAQGIEEIFLCYDIDLNIEPDISLFNSMIEACSTVEAGYRSYTLWQQVRLSAAGSNNNSDILRQPNAETFKLLLKVASETGAGYADVLWEEFRNYPQVQLMPVHYKYYVAAQCESQRYEMALQVASQMQTAFELPPTVKAFTDQKLDDDDMTTTRADVISVLYNYMQTPVQREQVRDWARLVFPKEWKDVRIMPTLLQKLELRGFNSALKQEDMKGITWPVQDEIAAPSQPPLSRR